MDRLELTLDQLVLDTENPRFGTAKGQREALQCLLDEQKEKLAVLAESIVNDGLSPLDRLLVMQDQSDSTQYTVLEGNRRLAVNKLLANPALLSTLQMSDSLRKRLLALAKMYRRKNIEPIECAVVKTRSEATSWLHLRHTGQNEGKGIVDWSGIQAARFRGTDPALQAIEFVKSFGSLTEDQRNAIEGKPFITTLARLLSSVAVRNRLGIEVKDSQLITGLPNEEIVKPLRKIVLDLATGEQNVSRLKNQAQQLEYIEKLDAEHKPDFTKIGPTRPIDPGPSSQPEPAKAKPTSAKRISDPSKRVRLIPKGTKLNITDPRPAEIFGELKNLHLEENPNAIAVLLRVFLELSVDYYMSREKIPMKTDGNDKRLNIKILEVISHIEKVASHSKKDFAGVRRAMSDKNSPLHCDTLHAYVHNRFSTPKPRDLTAAWDDARPLFGNIWS